MDMRDTLVDFMGVNSNRSDVSKLSIYKHLIAVAAASVQLQDHKCMTIARLSMQENAMGSQNLFVLMRGLCMCVRYMIAQPPW